VRWRGGTGGEALRPIPKPGTATPAWPRRFTAPWLTAGAGCCIASPYDGGAGGVYSSTFSFWRGGSLGGRPGGFPLAGGTGGGIAAFGLDVGGFGRFAVLSPVVSVLYGPCGFGSCSALLCASSRSCKRCLAEPGGAELGPPETGDAPGMRFGGGAKVEGSFRVESGADWCSRADSAWLSLPCALPTHPFCSSQ
jgi:hypothetical protein